MGFRAAGAAAASLVILGCLPALQASAVTTIAPASAKTAAGVVADATRAGEDCPEVALPMSRISRGFAVGYVGCGPGGATKQWAYNGTRWGTLAAPTQDFLLYPPPGGTIKVCAARGTIPVYSRATSTSTVVARLKSGWKVWAGATILVRVGRGSADGIAFYRVSVAGRTGYVSSPRVAPPTASGCADWKAYWSYRTHV